MKPNPLPPIVLASTSPYRKRLLESMGAQFSTAASNVDEDQYKTQNLSPQKLCETLAYEKAASVHKNHPESIVIGSDQLVSFQGRILGKPKTIEKNIEQLMSLQGRSHELLTSVCVLYKKEVQLHTDLTQLHMRALSHETIESYVRLDQAIDCAGGYKLESGGVALFESIKSDDHNAIIGLPLIALCQMFLNLNFPLPNMFPSSGAST